MLKTILVLSLLTWGVSGYSGVVDFGRPEAPTTTSQTTVLPISGAGTNQFVLDLTPFTGPDGRTLSSERVSVEGQTLAQPVSMDLSPYRIGGVIYLPLTLRIEPQDRPGTYTAELEVRRVPGGKVELYQLRVQIQSWIVLELLTESVQLYPTGSPENWRLSTDEGLLRISSNAPWELDAALDVSASMWLEVFPDPRVQVLHPQGLLLREAPQQIAVGQPTASQPIILGFGLRMEDYRQIRAGVILLPTVFHLRPREVP